uniref:F-box domain-containing protein n=1 Tax=Globodera rostochiensis TaxID=31243 RepID=A0A914H7F0_GLORO
MDTRKRIPPELIYELIFWVGAKNNFSSILRSSRLLQIFLRPRIKKWAGILNKKVRNLQTAANICRQNRHIWDLFWGVWEREARFGEFKASLEQLLEHQIAPPENMYESIGYLAIDVVRPQIPPKPAIRIPTPTVVASVVYDPVFEPEAGPSNMPHLEQPPVVEQPPIPRHSLVPVSDAKGVYGRYKKKFRGAKK